MRGARCYPPHIALHCTNPTRQIASQMMAYGVGGVPGPGDMSHFFWPAPLYPGGPSTPVPHRWHLRFVYATPCLVLHSIGAAARRTAGMAFF